MFGLTNHPVSTFKIVNMTYEDLKCEFCDGKGEREKFVEPYGDSPVICSFCEGTGIHENLIGEVDQFLQRLQNKAHHQLANEINVFRKRLIV